MKNILGLFILAIVLIGCAPSQVVPTSTLSPVPPTATAIFTSTPEPKIHTLRIEFSTTSDWSTLKVLVPGIFLDARLVSEHGDLTNARAGRELLVLNQTVSSAEAGKSVSLTVDFDVSSHSFGEPVAFLLEKGGLNDSVVRFYNVIGSNVYFLREVAYRGIVLEDTRLNPYQFSFDLRVLEDAPLLSHLAPTATATAIPSPYNLSFEYDGNWEFDQRWKYFSSEYSTEWTSSGDKSLKLFYRNSSDSNCEINPWDRVEVSGKVDLTNANYIVYDVMPLNPESWARWDRSRRKPYPLGLEIYIDNNFVSVLSEAPQELRGQFVPLENLTGIHTLKFVFHPLQPRGCGPGEFGIYLDNLRFLSSDQFLSSLPPMPTPIPTFADVSAEALLFSEDFEDKQVSGWTGGGLPGDPLYGNTWDIRDDVYGNHYWQGAGSYGWPQRFYAPQDWTDYALEVRFRDVSPKDKGGVWICVRSSEQGNSFYAANIGTAGNYQLAIYDGTEYRELKGGNRTFLKNQWYLVRLEAQGDEIRLFVDNELLMTVTDSTLSNGTIGFYMDSGSYIHIDDIRVWSLP